MIEKSGFLWSFRECMSAPAILGTGKVSHLAISEQFGFYLAKLIYTPVALKNSLRRAHHRLSEPPHLGEVIICLFVAPEKQVDRLADFEELFTIVWFPKFGARIARLIYITHAVRSAGAIVRIGVMTAIVDRLIRAFGS